MENLEFLEGLAEVLCHIFLLSIILVSAKSGEDPSLFSNAISCTRDPFLRNGNQNLFDKVLYLEVMDHILYLFLCQV